MAAEIFISHSSKDIGVAETLCSALESRGLGCWISSRDVDAGDNFAEAIVDAIAHAKVMLLVFSANANNSSEIKKELVVASYNKTVVIPVRVEDVVPSGAMRYELATRQWIDLFADWEREVDRLTRRIKSILTARKPSFAGDAPTVDAAFEERGALAADIDAGLDAPDRMATMFHDVDAAKARRLSDSPAALASIVPLLHQDAAPSAANLVRSNATGSFMARWCSRIGRRSMLVLCAAAALAFVVTATIVVARHFRTTPTPAASGAALRPPEGETAGYVGGLDPYGDNYLSLRTGPGSEFPEIYRMGENTFVRVISGAGKWTQVRLNGGQVGWAYSQYLRPGYPH